MVQRAYDASAPSSGGVLLANHYPRTALGPMTNDMGVRILYGLAVLIGSILIVVAVGFLAGVALGTFTLSDIPLWLASLVALVVAISGALMVVVNGRTARNIARARLLRATHAGEPWRWDYAWDERGTGDAPGVEAVHAFVQGILVIGFVLPMLLGMFGRVPLAIFLTALLLAALAAGHLVRASYLAARRLKYGRFVALYERFPFRRGSTLELRVEVPRALPPQIVPTATLRCVQERDPVGERNLEFLEVYRDTASGELITTEEGAHAFRVRFAIPADAPATDFVSYPHRYWEVDVEASARGVDYAARFLVPVY